jgi:hypothetical protein
VDSQIDVRLLGPRGRGFGRAAAVRGGEATQAVSGAGAARAGGGLDRRAGGGPVGRRAPAGVVQALQKQISRLRRRLGDELPVRHRAAANAPASARAKPIAVREQRVVLRVPDVDRLLFERARPRHRSAAGERRTPKSMSATPAPSLPGSQAATSPSIRLSCAGSIIRGRPETTTTTQRAAAAQTLSIAALSAVENCMSLTGRSTPWSPGSPDQRGPKTSP